MSDDSSDFLDRWTKVIKATPRMVSQPAAPAEYNFTQVDFTTDRAWRAWQAAIAALTAAQARIAELEGMLAEADQAHAESHERSWSYWPGEARKHAELIEKWREEAIARHAARSAKETDK